MDQLIPVINKLQDVFNTLGTDPLDLPQIVVVGSQSSGKSSVLENIVGRDFLPRGSGIVTRRPLILQLTHLPIADDDAPTQEWGEFLHKPNDMFYEFSEIRDEIIKDTDRLTGKNKGISAQPINLKIYSPHVVNLTLVDLPGITKVPVGDQPSDIESQIRRMIMAYIKRPNAIILAVTPANTDLANSDALQLAREVDPEGKRTIGVITKLDLMDKGTDAMDVLTGRVIPLTLGFVGVINRSQEDIISKKSIRDSLKSEILYFKNHPIYKNIANRSGTAYLSKTLNKLLMFHIRDCLPELKVKVSKMLSEVQQELTSYGDPLYDTKNSQGALLLQIITIFSTNFKDAIDGKLTDLSTNELCGGARISYIFNEVFSQCINSIDPMDGVSLNDIRTTMRNATGPRAAIFIPEVSFELLVKRQVSRLEDPSTQCVELVYDELQRIIAQLEAKELSRFINLKSRVIEVVNNLLQKHKMPTKSMIENLIKIELAFINTSHPDFVGGDGILEALVEKKAQQEMHLQMLNHQQNTQSNQNGQNNNQNVANPLWVPNVNQKGGYPPQPAPQNQAKQPAGGPQQQQQQQQQQQPQQQQSSSKPVPGGRQQQQSSQDQPQGSFFSSFFRASPDPTSSNSNSMSYSNQSNNPSQSIFNYQQQHSNNRLNEYRSDKLSQVPSTIKASEDLNSREKFETEIIRELLLSYFNIVKKNVKDTVPKSIMHFLVNQSKEQIQNELVGALYREELFDELLEESPQISSKRKSCKAMIDVLRKANEIINEIRDFSSVSK
ncbi:dynamin like protein [Cavenderia fasciculata]|uniref:Dynamin like protein n=1 Tax=Cavenderia fasciculata TaxID=261658 RepID=F4PJM7_CACFS|nr:dynamin like protein [Cavenderia fasciculata]EGG23801.1 dynamin like protein [Cavenderia fasciculata]|eukprot:XP_004361652.1 dynamin like protein [Cavenderia fasciculata]